MKKQWVVLLMHESKYFEKMHVAVMPSFHLLDFRFFSSSLIFKPNSLICPFEFSHSFNALLTLSTKKHGILSFSTDRSMGISLLALDLIFGKKEKNHTQMSMLH